MQSVLFFDERDVTATVKLRTGYPTTSEQGVAWEGEYHRSHDSLNGVYAAQHAGFVRGGTHVRFGCSGSMDVPEVQATLVWWLDQEAPIVHVLVTSGDVGAMNYNCRKLSVDVPVPHHAILTCGLSLVQSTTLAVVWTTTNMSIGFVMFRVQRTSDHQSTLLLIPEGKETIVGPVRRIVQDFASLAGGGSAANQRNGGFTQNADNEDDDEEEGADGRKNNNNNNNEIALDATTAAALHSISDQLSACVLNAPREPQSVASVMITNGVSIWVVDIFSGVRGSADAVQVSGEKYDDLLFNNCDVVRDRAAIRAHRRNNTAASEDQRSSTLWKLVDLWRRGRDDDTRFAMEQRNAYSEAVAAIAAAATGPRGFPRYFVCLSSVQNSSLVALTRWDGVIFILDSNLRVASTTTLLQSQLPACNLRGAHRVKQWSMRSRRADAIHVCLSLDSPGEPRCVWMVLPHVGRVRSMQRNSSSESWEDVGSESVEPNDNAAQESISILAAPSVKCTAVSCAAVQDDTLSIVWDLGVSGYDMEEEAAEVYAPLPVASLPHSAQSITHAVQMHHVDSAHPTHASSNVFLSQSSALHGVANVSGSLVLLEKVQENTRAHVVFTPAVPTFASPASPSQLDVLRACLHSSLTSGRYGDAAPHSKLPLKTINLISLVSITTQLQQIGTGSAFCNAVDAFRESVAMATSHLGGTMTLANIILDAIHNAPVGLNLGGFQILSSAATLSGYTPSVCVGEQHIREVLQLVMSRYSGPASPDAEEAVFCSFSRRFIQHAVAEDILGRISFLICAHVAWVGAGTAYTSSSLLPHVRRTLSLLCAAYNAVVVAGPMVPAIIKTVRSSVVADVVHLLLGIETDEEEEQQQQQESSSSSSSCNSVGWCTNYDDKSCAYLQELHAVYIAQRLRSVKGSGTASTCGLQACHAWCKSLVRCFPLLEHFIVLHDVDACRTTRGSQWKQSIERVSQHLSLVPTTVAMCVLTDYNFHMGITDITTLPLTQGGATNASQLHAHHVPSPSFPTTDPSVAASQWRSFVTKCCTEGLQGGAYRLAWLRRLVPLAHPEYGLVDTSLIRTFFLSTALEMEQVLVAGVDAEASQQEKVVTKVIHSVISDAMLGIARLSLAENHYNDAFHYMAEVLRRGESSIRDFAVYADYISKLVCEAVSTSFRSPMSASHPLEDALIESSDLCAAVSEAMYRALQAVGFGASVVGGAAAGSMPTQPQQQRARNALALYRFLLHRGAFGQAAQAMNDMASHARLTPSYTLQVNAVVSHFSALAVTAAELIADAPLAAASVAEAAPNADEAVESQRAPHGFRSAATTPSGIGNATAGDLLLRSVGKLFHASGFGPQSHASGVGSDSFGLQSSAVTALSASLSAKSVSIFRSPLSRDQLPKLKWRLYLSSCERKLMQRSFNVDSAVLWMEDINGAAFQAAAQKVIDALCEFKLWKDARTLSDLLGLDTTRVLRSQAAFLVRYSRYAEEDGSLDGWLEFVAACSARSTVENSYAGLRCAVLAAATNGYTNVFPGLISAMEKANVYALLEVLLQAHEALLAPSSSSSNHLENSDALSDEANSTNSPQPRSVRNSVERDEQCVADGGSETEADGGAASKYAQAWATLRDAFAIACRAIRAAVAAGNDDVCTSVTLSGGLLDRLAVKARKMEQLRDIPGSYFDGACAASAKEYMGAISQWKNAALTEPKAASSNPFFSMAAPSLPTATTAQPPAAAAPPSLPAAFAPPPGTAAFSFKW